MLITSFFSSSLGCGWNAPTGSLVAFTLIDSAGHSAGTTYFYNIQDTSDSSCLPAIKPEPTVRIQVNTTSLDACDFIGVGFSGGVPPYSCLVTPVNSYRFLDVPLGNGNAGFSWLNTLPASTQILVTGVDSRGQLSATSPVVSSTSTNSSVCIGSSSALLGPVSGKDTFDSNADPRNNGNGGMGAGIIAGTVVGTIAAIAVLAGLAYLYYRRRRRLRRSPVTPAGDISPFANDDEDYESARPVFGAGSSGNDAAPAGALAGPTSAIVAPTTYPEMRETGAAASLAAASTNRPASGAETDSLLAANTSTAASQATAAPPSPRRRPLPAPPRIITGRVPAPSNLTDAHSAMAGKTTGTADDASRSSAVLQHQDAGPAGPSRGQERVEEVPPPYIDRHGEIQ